MHGRSRNFRASAHFAIQVLGKRNEKTVILVCLFEVGFAGSSAERGILGGSASAGETFCFVSTRRSWSPTAFLIAESFVFGCLHSWDKQRNVVVFFSFGFFPHS